MLLLTGPSSARAQGDDPLPGVTVRYEVAGQAIERIEQTLGCDWASGLPIDVRPTEPIRVRYSGWFLPEGRQPFHWLVSGVGSFSLTIDDWTSEPRTIDDGEVAEFGPIPSNGTWRPFVLEAVLPVEQGWMQVSWRSGNEGIEPLPLHRLGHDPNEEAHDFTLGQSLFNELRCASCHATAATIVRPTSAPHLARRLGETDTERVRKQLQGHAAHGSRRMPDFSLTDQQVDDLLVFFQTDLLAADEPNAAPVPPPGDPRLGRELLGSLGCVACHLSAEAAPDRIGTGPALSDLGSGRSRDFLTRWLSDPQSVDPHASMPRMELNEKEIVDLVAAFTEGRETTNRISRDKVPEASAAERGRSVFESYRCGSCHSADRQFAELDAVEPVWLGSAEVDHAPIGCLGPAQDSAPHRPTFDLTDHERKALSAYAKTITSEGPRSEDTGQDYRLASPVELLSSHRCLSCHDRGAERSPLTDLAVASGLTRPDLESSRLTAPPLTGVGDKLRLEALHQAISSGSRRRAWLTTRMPRHGSANEWTEQLADWLRRVDRLPDSLATEPTSVPPAEALVHGPRLVTSSGFGCTSCHALGNHTPTGTLPHALGPDLSGMGERIERSWFDRWVRDPARMVPNMEMPSIRIPVSGVMHEELDLQLAAVWAISNTPGFDPPRAEPERVLSQTTVATGARAIVVRDTFRAGERRWISPLVMGLGNRHNVLFDDESGTLAAWWLGDTARQYTEGKTWFWAIGNTTLWQRESDDNEWLRQRDGDPIPQAPKGQFRADLLSWNHHAGQLVTEHQLHFAGPLSESEPIGLTQRWSPLDTAGADASQERVIGFRREVELSGLAADETLVWRPVAASQVAMIERATSRHWRIDGDVPWSLQWNAETTEGDVPGTVELQADRQGRLRITVDYLASIEPDRAVPSLEPPTESDPPRTDASHVIPGFRGQRLLPRIDWMPTSMSWRSPFELFVTSLDGQVWHVQDADRDGEFETATPFADSLAAPFGVHASTDPDDPYVDVLHKLGLVRLRDRDGDGFAESARRVAFGWGYTDDYHDWAVGLPREDNGVYWVAFACQQDARPLAASFMRGTVARLVPDPDQPDRFTIDVVSGGHRFPIGIARSSQGETFVSDNQGNFNPFNELNRVERGRRYGFLNAWERAQGLSYEETRPNVAIPHPWTRSVNGIAFLSALGANTEDHFGPWSGHLVGCEYDTRRLIRLSLDRVGDSVQGAAYPFSYETDAAYEMLQGPLTCRVAPDGSLYVGAIRDSGWGGANNIGRLLKFTFDPSRLPPGIAEVRARNDGFEIQFARPVVRGLAEDAARYRVASYRRESTPAYGGPDLDRRSESIMKLEVAPDGLSVRLALEQPLRAGFVYEFSLDSLVSSGEFFPAEAFYTLNQIPE